VSALQDFENESAIDQVAFYDVGQGGANGLLSLGKVLAYFDFGGGVSSHTNTFPTKLNQFCFCHSHNPMIILSHWDHDHWSSEGRDTRAHSTTWLVPRQSAHGLKRGFHHNALITSILKHGKLLIWPTTRSQLRVGQVKVLQCTGKSKNASGLAVELLPPKAKNGKPVLFPGDAGYADLPTPQTKNFEAISCPHHGGNSHSPTIPTRPSGTISRLIYSYGIGNSYKHPLMNTWFAHDHSGWRDPRAGRVSKGDVRNTADRGTSGLGHVGFAWVPITALITTPCMGSCQLDIQQT
jgi:hypothetical protein